MPSYKQEEPKSNSSFFVEPGIYRVEVKNAIEKNSQNGNPMIKVIAKVITASGGAGPEIHDHLVFTAKASRKIDQFLASIGRAVIPGEEVNIEANDLIGVTGVALIGEEPGQTNPDQKFNTIERWIFGEERTDWLKKQSEPRVGIKPQMAKIKDPDEIPF
jgi:hypothetical protein